MFSELFLKVYDKNNDDDDDRNDDDDENMIIFFICFCFSLKLENILWLEYCV